jgi:Spy/CpxP family protein refolding chaperone
MRNQRLSQLVALLFSAWWLCAATFAQENKPRLAARDPRALFTPQEQQLIVYGLGNPIAQLLMLRELDRRWPLLPPQRRDLQQLNRDVAPRLTELRAKRARQERALEEAIYGTNFDVAQIEALANESATTQEELGRLQGETELRLMQILARGNPRRARTARAFVELMIQPQPQRLLPQLLLTRPNGGSMRFLAEFFGDDWEMAIPGFGNPATFLLALRQLELTPEQKAQLKTLAQNIRTEWQAEIGDRNQTAASLAAAPRESEELDVVELPAPRKAIVEQVIAASAARQARQIKRQTLIETRVRQTLQPKQWETYVTILRGLAGPTLNWTLPSGEQKKLMRQPNTSRPQPE